MAHGWRVIEQRETSMVRAGHLIDAVKVTYETSHGIEGSVTVPKSEYNANAVRGYIRKSIADHEAVRNLGETAT